MSFLFRSKAIRFLVPIALIALVGAVAFYSLASTGAKKAVHAAGTTTTFTGVAATTSAMQVTDTTAMPAPAAPQNADDSHYFGHLAHPFGGTSVGNLHMPSIASLLKAPGTLLQNFDGVNFVQSYTATGGLFGEPPDEGLGVGNGYVFNIVNRAGAIYTTNGATVKGPFSNNAFFGEAANALSSDPRTFYDKATNHWFATVLVYTLTPTGNIASSHVDLAVSTTGSPLGKWNVYTIDTTDLGNPGCPCLADYPILGIDQYNVYISTNEFTSDENSFNGAQVYAISKLQLLLGKTPLNYVHFGNLSIAGVIAYHLQPATTYGQANAEYFINSLDPNGTFDNRLGVWAMTNRQAVALGGVPTFTATVISSETYGLPVIAQTPVGFNGRYNQPTTGQLNPDDDAVQEVEYLNGFLYTALDTSITIPGDTGPRDGIAWFAVLPIVTGGPNGTISSATKVVDQGYISLQGLYLLYPHINHSVDGTTAIVFSFTGPTTYPTAAYAVRAHGQQNFGPVQVAAAGVTSDNGYTGTPARGGLSRWGDYSAGQLDPYSTNIWFATQYIPGVGNFAANWGNRVFEIKA